MAKNWLFYLVIVVTFLVGGGLQLIGLASNTTLTLFITILILSKFVFKLLIEHKFVKLNSFPFYIITLLIVLSSVVNSTKWNLAIIYFLLFVAVPYAIHYLVKSQLPKFTLKRLIDILILVAVVQLPVMIIESKFYSSIASISSREISETDISFGTFFVGNDHALCYLILSLITLLLFTNFKTQYVNKYIYVGWFVLTIAISNSKISLILLSIILVGFLVLRASTKLIVSVTAIILFVALIFAIIPDFGIFLEEKTSYIYRKINSGENEQYSLQRAIELGNADRTQIFYYYSIRPLKIIGEGPYNYYNPLTKKFSLFPNFSQILWFYNDLGILSIISLFFFYCYIFFKNNKLLTYKLLYLIMILVYTYFTNTLTDLAFNFIFFVFISNESLKISNNKNNKKYELSLHPVP